MSTPRLKTDNFTISLQGLGYDLYSFSLDFNHGSDRPELAMQDATSANLWHRRIGHLNRKSLDLLKNIDNNGVSFDGTVPDCDVCAVGKSHQLAHPKTTDHKVKTPFPAGFRKPDRIFDSEALGGYKYVTKISNEHTEWAIDTP